MAELNDDPKPEQTDNRERPEDGEQDVCQHPGCTDGVCAQ